MKIKLIFQAIMKFLLGVILVGLLIFLPTGTMAFPRAWFFMGILFLPMLAVGIVLVVKNPALLAKRLTAKETKKEQSLVVKLSGLMFVVGFIVAGLDFRFGWLPIPNWAVVAAAVVFVLSYLIYGEVLRENTYLSRTIGVQQGQKVIDTGLYSIVRHPMYSATIFLFLSMPLVLGSLYAFFVFLLYPLLIAKRIKEEERLLQQELPGYAEYQKKVKYRLIPFVW